MPDDGGITMRSLDDDVKTRLLVQTADHDRSMEKEVRPTLAEAAERIVDPWTAA